MTGGSPPRGRGERILWLDDEIALSRLGHRRVTELGYQAVALTSPEESLARAVGERFDLIVTDHTMPGMTGVELARRLAEAGVTTPIILLSGMAANLDPATLTGTRTRRVLEKPINTFDLATAIREALEPGPGSQE